jgi:hypothetical protein
MMKKAICWTVLFGGLALGAVMSFGEISHRAITAPLAQVYVNDVETVAGIAVGTGVILSPNSSSAFTLQTGLLYFDSSDLKLKYYDGTTLWTVGTGN